VRIKFGARSHAEALRLLIRRGGALVEALAPEPPKAAKPGVLAEAPPGMRWAAIGPSIHVDVPLAGTFERKPYQKGQKKP
jgi:hypothetical protein